MTDEASAELVSVIDPSLLIRPSAGVILVGMKSDEDPLSSEYFAVTDALRSFIKISVISFLIFFCSPKLVFDILIATMDANFKISGYNNLYKLEFEFTSFKNCRT
ncbi:unnamed protein product [[Candida] boidinii]|nr:unnamed protein product [[Candida] boidinii]